MTLIETDLGKKGNEYVVSCLTRETGLCPKLLKEIEGGGDVFAPLPVTTPRDRAVQFKMGGLLSQRETYAWFDRHVGHLVGSAENGSLVFQDVWARPADMVARDGAYFGSSSVYYILGPGGIDAAAISGAVRSLISFQLVAAFCNFPFHTEDVPATRHLNETLIDKMASTVQEVFVSAYDQEGLVVWRRALQP